MSPEGKKYNHLHNGDKVKFAEPGENSFDVLLRLVNTVKNKGLILESKLCLALIYALYGIDNSLRHQDFPADTASLGFLDSKELYLADLAELFLYNKEMDRFRKVLGTLEKISENLLLDVNHNPVYLHTRIAILHAMAGDSPDFLLKTIKLIKKFPGRAPETLSSINNMLITIADVIILSRDGKALLPEITDLLEMVPRNQGRDDMAGYVARKLCLRNEVEPTDNISYIEFARDKMMPDMRDGTEIDFTKIQMAVALSKYSSPGREKSEDMNALSLKLIGECENKLKNSRNTPETIMIKFNLVRGYDQVGLHKSALSLKNDLTKDLYRDLESFESTMSMIETVRKINNNRFPRDIAELEENVLDMATGNLSAIPMSLTLAGHYSEDEQFALGCLSEAENMTMKLPFIDMRKEVLYQIAGAYAYRGMKDRSIEAFRKITGIISQLTRSESTDEFMDSFTDRVGEAFQYSPDPGLIKMWEDFGKDLKLSAPKHEESVKFLLNCIFSHKRSWFWNVSFSD